MKHRIYALTLVMLLLFTLAASPVIAQPEEKTNAQYRMDPVKAQLLSLSDEDIEASAKMFPDISAHWARQSIGRLTATGIINGMPDGTFLPENFVRVDEFIKMTVTSLGYKLENGTDYWAESFISAALEENLIDEGEFSDYTRYITRQEASKIIVRTVMLVEAAPGSTLQNYIRSVIADYPEIGDVYKQYVIDAYAIGLLTGTPDRKFNPLSNLKRCEASVIILRGLDPEERVPTKPDDSEMLVLNDFYGNSYEVYPSENPETFETAVALNNSISKSKGYAVLIYNPFEEIISCGFFENENEFKEEMPEFQGMFAIRTTDNYQIEHPYTVTVDKPEEFKELHRDVIVDVFKYLFDSDAEKALTEFDEYIELSLVSGPAQQSINFYNNRKVRFYIVQNDPAFTMWIFNKEN